MLLILQMGLTIGASVRGWKALPFILVGIVLAIGFTLGLSAGATGIDAVFGFMFIVDLVLTGVLLWMAIAGKEE